MKVRNFLIGGLAAGALALSALPAFAVQPDTAVDVDPVAVGVQNATQAACDDGDAYSWKANDPARYNTEDREVTLGNSNATRTVTITAPEGCEFEEGDRWRVYNGYFSASGYISAGEAGERSNTDGNVVFETPESSSVAGDELDVKLKVDYAGSPAGYEVDEGSVEGQPLVLLRRTIFKYNDETNRINFHPEPYNPDAEIRSTGNLLRASWTNKNYAGYDGRTVGIQVREDVTGSPYDDIHQRVVTFNGGKVRSSLVLSDADAATPDDGDIIVRARYGGDGTSSGNVSRGDRLVEVS